MIKEVNKDSVVSSINRENQFFVKDNKLYVVTKDTGFFKKIFYKFAYGINNQRALQKRNDVLMVKVQDLTANVKSASGVDIRVEIQDVLATAKAIKKAGLAKTSPKTADGFKEAVNDKQTLLLKEVTTKLIKKAKKCDRFNTDFQKLSDEAKKALTKTLDEWESFIGPVNSRDKDELAKRLSGYEFSYANLP
jgi:hypothetical protein